MTCEASVLFRQQKKTTSSQGLKHREHKVVMRLSINLAMINGVLYHPLVVVLVGGSGLHIAKDHCCMAGDAGNPQVTAGFFQRPARIALSSSDLPLVGHRPIAR